MLTAVGAEWPNATAIDEVRRGDEVALLVDVAMGPAGGGAAAEIVEALRRCRGDTGARTEHRPCHRGVWSHARHEAGHAAEKIL